MTAERTIVLSDMMLRMRENIMEYKIAHPREIKGYKQSANGVFWTLSVEDYLSPAAESPRKK